MKKYLRTMIFIIVIFVVLLALRDPFAVTAGYDASPISGVVFDDNTLVVIRATDDQPPAIDQTLGLLSGRPSLGFIAHDYLAGDHIRTMYVGEKITLIYSDGTTKIYEVYVIGSVPANTLMIQIYYQPGEIVFQTCMEDNLRFIVKARPVL